MQLVCTDTLVIACREVGPTDGWPVVLSHGFPYDVHAYDEVAPILAAAGARVIMPFLRGFGPTRFRHAETMRSGQQAALGSDLVGLLDGLGLERAVVAGYDWGGLAYAMAADQPDRISRIALGEAIIPGVAVSPPLIPDERPLNDFLWHNNFCRVRGVTEELVAGREDIFFDYQFTKIPVPNPIPAQIRSFYIDLIKRDRRTLRASFDYYRAIDDDIPANRARMNQRLTMPVLGFAGELACAGAVEEQLRRVADDVRCTVIKDCGHFVPEEAPDRLIALLTTFLEPYSNAAA